MTTRQWLPTEYEDEVVPPLRDKPDDWLVFEANADNDGGSPIAYLAAFDDLDDERRGRLVQPGDIVRFSWRESYGTRTVVFKKTADDDGESDACDHWHMTGDTPKACEGGHLCVMEVGNPESMADSLEEFCKEYLDIEGWGFEGDVTVSFYAWSDDPVAYEYRDGGFHQVAMA